LLDTCFPSKVTRSRFLTSLRRPSSTVNILGIDAVYPLNDNMATHSASGPDLGKPQFASHKWVEPIVRPVPTCLGFALLTIAQVVVSIMVGSIIINRHRRANIVPSRHQRSHSKPLLEDDSGSEDLESDDQYVLSSSRDVDGKSRTCFGRAITTPNTHRFRNNFHSRILQKFPFLVEMFYWVLNYTVYSFTKGFAASLYEGKGNGVVELAQSHGINILWLEHDSIARFLFPFREVDVQSFFLGHTSAMTLLNRAYSLVHIPGTVL